MIRPNLVNTAVAQIRGRLTAFGSRRSFSSIPNGSSRNMSTYPHQYVTDGIRDRFIEWTLRRASAVVAGYGISSWVFGDCTVNMERDSLEDLEEQEELLRRRERLARLSSKE